MTPLVTISMPVGPRTPFELVQRATDAVMAQTERRWLLVQVGDGTALPSNRLGDPRIVRYTLPENRGRYFADAVVFEATDSPYFTVHDSDDAARPGWLSVLLRTLKGADAAYGAQSIHRIGSRQPIHDAVVRWRGIGDPPRLRHHCHMAQLFRREWLAEIGGPHPAFRVGFDTLLTALPFISGFVATTEIELYDRFKRGDSLTTAIETGMRSQHRKRAAADLARLWCEAVEAYRADAATGSCGHASARHLIRQVLTAYPSVERYQELKTEVEHHGKRLREMIGE